MNIVEKYYWITQHPKYVPFGDSAIIEITPHMVCPETNRIENLPLLNTKLQFWVELMIPFFDEHHNQHCNAHDVDVDCGGDTWEEAVENLYQLVLEKYGDYTEDDISKHQDEAMKGFDVDEWLNSCNILADEPNTDEIVMLPDYEIEHMKSEILLYEELEKTIHSRMADRSITMQEYFEYEVELIAVQHDLYVLRKNVKHGYDVEKYGLGNED